MSHLVSGTVFSLKSIRAAFGAVTPEGEEYVNSLGMRFVRIKPGSFVMGADATPLPEELTADEWRRHGDFDEHPAHKVTISNAFYMACCQVTNAQYEEFDPEHRNLRGKRGFSKADDEAVVFVSWHDAARFCEWLSEKEWLPYRLPTEAEWEYACRAGTATPFHTGDTLPEEFLRNAGEIRISDTVVPLVVGQTPPNARGLCDMHGNVEEWCYDWYGPYEAHEQADPVGRSDGDFRVSRGGSHSTEIYYLRSANRMGTIPEDRNWFIGFRLVMGEMPKTQPLPLPPPQLWQIDVKQEIPSDLAEGPDPEKPYFKGPRRYVKIPPNSDGPLFSHHNHDPALVKCPNGDLLAIWYTCVREYGRELALAASRLRYGAEEWDPASPFWDAPDRNDHAPATFFDGKDTLYHFNGLSAGPDYRRDSLGLIMRTSRDNGVTWSKARFVSLERGTFHQPVSSQPVACSFRTSEGHIVFISDGSESTSVLWISRDEGETWAMSEGRIAGIHAGVVQLRDGRLLAFGRGRDIDDRMPKSVSDDMGKTWTYSPSIFPPLSAGQRLILMRLREGPIFFASFTGNRREPTPMPITDASGKELTVTGLFGALSFDEGKTWPCIRLITDDGPGREVETMDGRPFIMDASNAEPGGYMTGCQTDDGVIHIISSYQHYAFNLEWLKTPPSSV